MKLEIKNFGPIKEGKIETKKVTVLIGNQGSGKSTVAKLLATFCSIEKDTFMQEKKFDNAYEIKKKFLNFLNYYCIDNYKKIDDDIYTNYINSTDLHFRGSICEFDAAYRYMSRDYDEDYVLNIDYIHDKYQLPRITYFPSERNFVSSVKNSKDGLVYKLWLQSLQEFKEIFQEAKESLKNSLKLPINNTEVEYNNINGSLYVKGDNYKTPLSDSASGFQSFVPMFVVADYLSKLLKEGQEMNSRERERFKKESSYILNNPIFTDEQKSLLLSNLAGRINIKRTINIIEEPEQNLYPSSQRSMLNSLLGYNNEVDGNELILTTHSPYILSYLMLAVKAAELRDKANGNDEILSKIYGIVPEKAITPIKDVVIYELNDDGTISELKQVYGLPSNDNFLNNELGEVNTLFSELMEIEDLCHE